MKEINNIQRHINSCVHRKVYCQVQGQAWGQVRLHIHEEVFGYVSWQIYERVSEEVYRPLIENRKG